jgi:NADP-dependent 3-hydroxy acid dehydrogenase YdfG
VTLVGPGDIERAFPLWESGGYLTRVARASSPMDAGDVADALQYIVSQPRGVMLDVVHIRSTGL